MEDLTKPAPSIAAFTGTTQCKHWIFTAEQLVSKRKESNQKAAESVLRIAPSPGKRPKIEEGAAAGQSVGGIVDCVTPEEELTLQEYWLNGILKTKARGTLSLPPNVEATSVLFFKRFFLSNSIMDCHPKEVMITAMWLACKVEHYPYRYLNTKKVPHEKDGNFKFDANHFAEMGGFEPERLLRREQDMLRALKYHLMTFHAYRPLRGLVAELRSLEGVDDILPPEEREKMLKELDDSAQKEALVVMATDAPFFFHPAQLALYTLREAAVKKKISPELLDKFLEKHFPEEQDRADLDKVCDRIRIEVKKVNRGKKEATRIEKKLMGCRNPDKNYDHPLFQQREARAQEEKHRHEEEKTKREEEQRRIRSEQLCGTTDPPDPPKSKAQSGGDAAAGGGFVLSQPP